VCGWTINTAFVERLRLFAIIEAKC
jgi:hypothetical protein